MTVDDPTIYEQLRRFGKVSPYPGDMQDEAPLVFARDSYVGEALSFFFGPAGDFGLPVTNGRLVTTGSGRVTVHERVAGEVGLPAVSEFDTLGEALVYIRLKSTTWG